MRNIFAALTVLGIMAGGVELSLLASRLPTPTQKSSRLSPSQSSSSMAWGSISSAPRVSPAAD
jgi:hypothetical protein